MDKHIHQLVFTSNFLAALKVTVLLQSPITSVLIMLLYCKMGNIFNPSFRLFAQSCKSTPHAKALENGNPAKARTCRRQYSSTTAHLGTCGAFKRAFGLHVIIYLANFNHLLRKRVITAPLRISEVQYTRCDWTVFGGVVLSFDGQLNPAVNHITLCGCDSATKLIIISRHRFPITPLL